MNYSLCALALAEAILWSESDDNGDSLDRIYDISNIYAPDLERLENEYDEFIEAANLLLENSLDKLEFFDYDNDDLSALGPSHENALEIDYILSRNDHGAGFWDGDWELGDELHKLAKAKPELMVYISDNVIYFF